MSTLVVLIALVFLLIALFRLQYAFFVFIFSLPFVPRYLAISVGSGMALSLKRLMVYSLLLVILLSIFSNGSQWKNTFVLFSRWRKFFLVLLSLYVLKAVSTFFAGDAINLVYWLDEFCSILVVFMLAARFIDDWISFKRLLLVLLLSVFGCELLSVVEYYVQHPLLQGVDVEVVQGWDIATGIFRGEKYRVTAGFDNPLLLSQFFCYVVPFVICSFFLGVRRNLAVICGLMLLPVIYMTDSRGGGVIFLIAIFLISAMHFQGKLVIRQKFLISWLIRFFAFFGGVMLLIAVSNPEWFLESVASDQMYVNSTSARLWQYSVVSEAISDRLMLGYGMMQNFNILENLGGIDNYYLRLLLEGGISALSLYLLHVFFLFNIAKEKINSEISGSFKRTVMIALWVSLATYVLSGFFVSMPTNNVYFYLSAALVFIIFSRGDEILKSRAVSDVSKAIK